MIFDYIQFLSVISFKDSLADDRFHQPAAAAQMPLSSFKRAPAPAMGGRAIEQRRDEKRSRSKGGERRSKDKQHQQQQQRVGQLDEKNLKRAANRYGTLPKDARIGAYLDSLRTSGMTPEPGMMGPVSDESGHSTLDSHKSGHTDPGVCSAGGGGRLTDLLQQQQSSAMARSNSSHGGFPGKLD